MTDTATSPGSAPQALARHFAEGRLYTRDMPKQARARMRVGEIMAAAVTVLEHRAPGDLSANRVADEAAVPVSSVYRYFPSIDDLAMELYLHAANALRVEVEEAASGPGGWRDRLFAALDVIARFLREHPYYRALLVRIAAARGPQTLTHDHNNTIVQFFARRWGAGLDGFTGGDPRIVAATTIQIALSLEELMLAQSAPRTEDACFRESKRALECYLALYLSDGPSAAPSTGETP